MLIRTIERSLSLRGVREQRGFQGGGAARAGVSPELS